MTPQEFERALDNHALRGLGPPLGGVAVIFFVFTFFNYFDLPHFARVPVIAHDLFLLVSSLGLLLAHRAGKIPARWASPLLAITGMAVASNVLLTATLLSEAFYAIHIMVLLIALGNVILAKPWLLMVTLGTLVAWIPVALSATASEYSVHFYFCIFLGVVVSIITHLTRRNALAKVERTRHRDEHFQKQLQEALRAAETALAEQKATLQQRNELEEQLIQSQKMDALGKLAGGIAHDLNNMLGVITGLASKLKAQTTQHDERWDDINDMLEAARRSSSLTRNLLGFARKGKYRQEIILLADVVNEVVRILGHSIPKNITITTNVPPSVPNAHGDPQQLAQALINVCLNAVQAMADGGQLEITVRSEQAPAESNSNFPWVVLAVRDNGPGMDEATRKQAFEPFFTTKEPGRGTGLGLSMVYGTIARHGGITAITSALGQGTLVEMKLPGHLSKPNYIRNLRASIKLVPSKKQARILVVDDEPLVRKTAHRILQSSGHTVLLASNGEEALQVYQRESVDLVIMDMSMPVMDGPVCFQKLKELDPKATVLLCSGYARGSATEDLLRQGAAGLLNKPFEHKELLNVVSVVLAAGPPPGGTRHAPTLRRFCGK